ncbi:MTH1187 family thiamine-binding protein [Rossellomorea vietnamensis]|uniref:MTH1187 family thiamine-binding protein n=1 Tax=Rossellomorea vietnamensis TaxID=218284 RepID=A0A5D4MHE8_9BACI|nr:MTH1187 family thiamine-binding protein [Rossellomorea vietnamensis]TYS00734.1 MTH1187 family thiamine-binding protein [Rossellomorea vietnamensis]
MAIVDVTVIPIGTATPSVSDYVAQLQKILKRHEDEGTISFKLTPMSTLIEGELPDLFRIVQEIHEAPFSQGIQRVATNIRIDDRRDKKRKMEDKLTSVENKM